MKKKVFILFLSAVLLFSQYTISQKEVQANAAVGVLAGAAASSTFPPALAAYIIGGLLVAGGAAVVADQYGPEIVSYSKQIWNSASQATKDVFNQAVKDTLQTGKTVLTLSDDFLAHLQSSVNGISDWIYEKLHTYEVGANVPVVTKSSEYAYINYSSSYYSRTFMIGGVLAKAIQVEMPDCCYPMEISALRKSDNTWVTLLTVSASSIPSTWRTAFNGIKSGSLDSMNDFLKVVGVGAAIPFLDNSVVPSLDNIKNNVADAVSSLQGIKEVAIPLDNFIAKTTDGKTITFTDVGTATVDGTPYTGQIDWTIPVPDVISNDVPTLSNPSVPITHVGVGDTPLVAEDATTGEGTGTDTGILTDIKTGVQTIADALTTGLVGDTSNINWDKLKMAGSAFTTAFPFSIPFDIGRAFDAVFGSFDDLRDMPSWNWHIHFDGHDYTINFKIDDYFLSWFEIIRAVMLILFDVGLVYAVRKMLGGAS